MRILFILLATITLSLPAAAQQQAMPLLHATRGIHAGIYDEGGRYALLRGANYNVLGEYWQGAQDAATTKQYDDHDIALMARYGFNCVRLLYTWSRVEPERGQYDTAYIARIRHAVETAAKYDMYVLLDMHQDAWGPYIATPDSAHCSSPARGWDGAPQWATITDGLPTCTRGSRETAPAVVRAFHNFWEDRDSLQQHCIGAWTHVAAATAQYPNVLGYDLINEPSLGERSIHHSNKMAGRYYDKLIRSLRATEQKIGAPQHIIFFEPSIAARGKERPAVPYSTFRPERNIVFSPHHYFGSLSNVFSIEQGFGLFRLISFFYHTDMLIGEWGFFGGATDTSKVKRYARMEDKYMLGSTWWQWAQGCGDPHSVDWHQDHWTAPDSSMHLIQLDRQGHFTGRVNEPVLHILSRSRPLAVPGWCRGFESDPTTGQLSIRGHCRDTASLKMWVPDRFGVPALTGAIIYRVDTVAGGYRVTATVKGRYQVNMGNVR